MTGDRMTSPAMRYKEITELATTADQRVHRWERERIEELTSVVAAGQQRKEAAEAEEQQVIEGVRRRWDEAMAELYHERWMRVTPLPELAERAGPRPANEAIFLVQSAYLDLRKALNLPKSWLPKPRRSKSPEDY